MQKKLLRSQTIFWVITPDRDLLCQFRSFFQGNVYKVTKSATGSVRVLSFVYMYINKGFKYFILYVEIKTKHFRSRIIKNNRAQFQFLLKISIHKNARINSVVKHSRLGKFLIRLSIILHLEPFGTHSCMTNTFDTC